MTRHHYKFAITNIGERGLKIGQFIDAMFTPETLCDTRISLTVPEGLFLCSEFFIPADTPPTTKNFR
jgi:hypothetical protein